MQVTINIPPYYDIDVFKVDTQEPFGVGRSSNPAEFYNPAADGEMHLKGMAKHDGTLSGLFRVSIPNGDGGNGRPVYPSPKWGSDPPGNARADDVRFGFQATSALALPAGAIQFVPGAIARFDLGTEQTVEVRVNTKDLGECGPNGRFEGNVIVWHDANHNGAQDAGEVFDQFGLGRAGDPT
jgi:hypothetical protein